MTTEQVNLFWRWIREYSTLKVWTIKQKIEHARENALCGAVYPTWSKK